VSFFTIHVPSCHATNKVKALMWPYSSYSVLF